MNCINCKKPFAEWDKSYIDNTVGMPKYFTEIKSKEHIERLALCGPYCSLEYWEKKQCELKKISR
jgi:hypothetical protein